jgi:hypothetical protein
MKKALMVLLVLLLASLACNFSIGGGGVSGGGETQDDSVLFQDDFSDTGSGWDRTTNENGATDYQDGGYHIYVAPEFYSLWANPGRDFTDVRVEVVGHKISGVDDNEYGVICRYVDVGNFYAASVSSDGFYAIIRLLDGSFEYLGMEAMQTSDAVNQGSDSNHIRLDCVGSTLTLYVNSTQVATATDSSFSSGDVGLYAGTFNSPDIDILFDDFVVYRP